MTSHASYKALIFFTPDPDRESGTQGSGMVGLEYPVCRGLVILATCCLERPRAANIERRLTVLSLV